MHPLDKDSVSCYTERNSLKSRKISVKCLLYGELATERKGAGMVLLAVYLPHPASYGKNGSLPFHSHMCAEMEVFFYDKSITGKQITQTNKIP